MVSNSVRAYLKSVLIESGYCGEAGVREVAADVAPEECLRVCADDAVGVEVLVVDDGGEPYPA